MSLCDPALLCSHLSHSHLPFSHLSICLSTACLLPVCLSPVCLSPVCLSLALLSPVYQSLTWLSLTCQSPTCLSLTNALLSPVCVSGAVVLRVPVLFGEVESVSESAVTSLWLKVQEATESCTLDHCQQRFPTDTRDVAAVCRKLSERARQVHNCLCV